jgi:putative FmdB family regulatory protein
MPIYEFECDQCGSRFEGLMASAGEVLACPDCGADRTRRRLSPVSPPGRVRRGAKVRDSKSGRRDREAARSERLADARKARKST